VFEAFRAGVTINTAGARAGGLRRANFSGEESAVLALLKKSNEHRAESKGRKAA
jgi:hypothetical protein